MPKRKDQPVDDEKKPAKKSFVTRKIPKTLKDKILDLVSKEEQLISLIAMKKILAEQYDCGCANVKESTAMNTKINKTLKSLVDENRDDFGKIGGSYHGGEQIVAYLNHMEATAQGGDCDNGGEDDDEVNFRFVIFVCWSYQFLWNCLQDGDDDSDDITNHRDDIQCPHCSHWNNEWDVGGEDADFSCLKCGNDYYTWRCDDMKDSRTGHRFSYEDRYREM